jgi:hypothetical protein
MRKRRIAMLTTMFATVANCVNAYVAVVLRIAASPFIISALLETARILAVTLAVFAVAMAYPRTRRSSVALLRFTRRYSPRWAIPVLTVAAFVPGQADEIVVIAIVLIPILANARKRAVFGRYLRLAWRG